MREIDLAVDRVVRTPAAFCQRHGRRFRPILAALRLVFEIEFLALGIGDGAARLQRRRTVMQFRRIDALQSHCDADPCRRSPACRWRRVRRLRHRRCVFLNVRLPSAANAREPPPTVTLISAVSASESPAGAELLEIDRSAHCQQARHGRLLACRSRHCIGSQLAGGGMNAAHLTGPVARELQNNSQLQ